MAITASGAYGLTLEKMLLKTQTNSLEADVVWCLMVNDTHAPNFDTHDFVADITNEIANGDGYTTGGMDLAGNTVTVGSPAAGQIKFDSDNPAWATSTITSAMAAVLYFTTGNTTTDQLIFLSDFVTAATSSNGTFTITVSGDGWFYIDYTP
jgi:hypothetical protein